MSAKYVMKCDDDTFVRLDAVMDEVKKVPEGKSLYIGNINYYHKPLRYGKWAVTYEVRSAPWFGFVSVRLFGLIFLRCLSTSLIVSQKRMKSSFKSESSLNLGFYLLNYARDGRIFSLCYSLDSPSLVVW